MGVDIIFTLFMILTLIVLSGFFSGSETALTAVSKARMHTMELEGSAAAGKVNRLLEKPERIIGTVLLGNNLVNIMASSLTTSLLIGLFGDVGVAYATLGLTLLIVIFFRGSAQNLRDGLCGAFFAGGRTCHARSHCDFQAVHGHDYFDRKCSFKAHAIDQG